MTTQLYAATARASGARAQAWPISPIIAFVAAVGCVLVPILLHRYLPMVDLPNHMARHRLMAQPLAELGTYYSYDFRLVPNSAVDLILRLSGYSGDMVRFSQMITALNATLLIGATMVLARVAHGRWTVWSTASGLLVFNGVFFWGFQNFLFSVPFALLGLALWLYSERWPTPFRVALFIPIAMGLCIMHFFAFGALAIAAFGRELQRVLIADKHRLRQFFASAALGIPFVIPVLWVAWLVANGANAESGGITISKEPALRILLAFRALAVGPGTEVLPIASQIINGATLLLIGICGTTLLLRNGPRLCIADSMKGPLAALLVAAVFAPQALNGVAYVHIRLPVVLVLCAIAATDWRGLTGRWPIVLVVVFGVAMIARGAMVERLAAHHSDEIHNLSQVLEDLPAGARLLPLRAPDLLFDHRGHVQAHAIIQANAFVPTLFQGVHSISVRPEWVYLTHPFFSAVTTQHALTAIADPASAIPSYLQDWRKRFSHVLLVDPIPAPELNALGVVPISTSGRFGLFKIPSTD